jgi:hypothetical protein
LHTILSAPKDEHARFRRVLAHAFSEKGLREQSDRIYSFVDSFIERLSALAKSGEVVDMVAWFNVSITSHLELVCTGNATDHAQMVTFDIIGNLAFGESFHSLDRGKLHPWASNIPGNVRYAVVGSIYVRLGLSRLIPYLLDKKTVADRANNFR